MSKLKNIVLPLCAFAALYVANPLFMYPRSPYWHQRVTLFDKLPISSSDIVFIGNSITDGGEFAELFDNENIKNRGINSDVISGVKERLPQVTSGAPSKIFLLIGINDVSHNLSAANIAGQYEDLVKDIIAQSPSSHLYIQSIFPINNDFGRYKNLKGKESVIVEVNKKLQEIAEKYNATYLDLTPALAGSDGKLRKEFTNDGLHLVGKGYKAWAGAIRQYVVE